MAGAVGGEVDFVGGRVSALAVEVVLEPAEGADAVIESGGGFAVAVAFPGVFDQADGGIAVRFEVAEEFTGLGGVDAGIGFAVEDEQGCAGLFGVADGAAFEEPVPFFPGVVSGVDEVHFVGDIRGAELGDMVADADEHDTGREMFGEFGGAPGGGVAAVGSSGDTDFFGIDELEVDEVLDGIDEVIEFGAGVVALAEFREFHAASGAAAVVRVKDCESLGCGDLAEARVGGDPSVGLVGFGAAVDGEDEGVALTGFFVVSLSRGIVVEGVDEDAFEF
ncbi:MAG: hypothetical protein RI897_4325 [Verrucomicrobiota bacterium]